MLHRLFYIAALFAASRKDERNYMLGALAIRKDGAIVKSRNSPSMLETNPDAHAEAKLCKKIDKGSIVYVARVNKRGHFAIARPCKHCMSKLRNKQVIRVYYTINDYEWGVIDFSGQIERKKRTVKTRLIKMNGVL